jgi:LPS sulfotransferase NodH
LSVGPRAYGPHAGREAGKDTRHPTLFIVFGHQRTGSTLLASRLNSHPKIRCHEEVFLPWVDSSPSMRDWLDDRRQPRWLRVVPGARRAFLASLVSEGSANGEFEAVGFKVMYNQMALWPKLAYLAPPTTRLLPDPALRGWLSSNLVLVIHMLRRNHLRTLVSHDLAAQSGRFHSRDSEVEVRKVTVSLIGLKARLRRIALAERVARATVAGLQAIEIYYEDYVSSDGAKEDSRLCDALGVYLPANGLSSSLTKLSQGHLRDTISNYDQVSRYLDGTRFATFLD